MALYGASSPYFAKIKTEPEEALPTYESGVKIAKLISSADNPTYATGTLYADDGKAEEAQEFVSADIEVSLDDVELAIKALIFGATASSDSNGELTYKGTDNAPYGGYAFYARKMVNNAIKYLGVYYPKVKASMGGVTYTTKGENITFSPTAVTFKANQAKGYEWKIESEFDTEAAAIAWIKTKLNISE